ncbi:MAG: sporulation protein YqfD, partial [Oscillospiraceae bacterium]
MVFLKLFRFLFGYVRFIIIGEFPERLLNQFSVNSVSIWNVVRKKEYIELSIMARDYKKMRKIRAQNKVRTRIVQKYGLSFALIKYKKRAGFVCGIALFFAVLNFMSLFIWNVRVCGNTYVDESIIKKELSQIGVYEGARRSGLDTDLIKNKLTLQIEDLSWAAIN